MGMVSENLSQCGFENSIITKHLFVPIGIQTIEFLMLHTKSFVNAFLGHSHKTMNMLREFMFSNFTKVNSRSTRRELEILHIILMLPLIGGLGPRE